MRPITIGQTITDRQDPSLKIYFKDVSCQPMIDAKEELELAKRAKKGDEQAFNKLICANLRFVISIAKQYQNKGMSLVDLIQSGNIGLVTATRLYNPDKGFRFISYAVWWIRQSIISAISDNCRTVRIPTSQMVHLSKINKASEKFEQLNNRRPTSEELSEYTDINPNKIDIALSSYIRATSLETPFSDDEDTCLLDIIPNSNSAPADTDINKKDLVRSIEKVLSKLSYRDRDVLRMSYGIGMNPLPNEEIAEKFGVGCERIRQIQHNAIKHIRKRYRKELEDLL